jgi:serine/threonine protein kinase
MSGGNLFPKIISRYTEDKPFTEKGNFFVFWVYIIEILKNTYQTEVANIMYQICSAVEHLHSMNIAHRGI